MAINEIIKQIDAYLALLHQARKILSSGGKRDSVARGTRSKRRTPANSRNLPIPRDRAAIKADSRERTSVAGSLSLEKRATGAVQVPLPKTLDPGPAVAMSSNDTGSAGAVVKRLPARRQLNPNRHAAHGRVKPGKQDSVKPPTALSNVLSSKIVVISAEQARIERERLTKPVAVRHRPPGSGATGRLAFEALFGR